MQRQVYELVSAIVLNPDIALVATRDALAIAEATKANEQQTLSIARGEAWRQLRARNIFAHDIAVFDATGDPVAGLTVMERTVLELSVRFRLPDEDVAAIVGQKIKEVQRDIKTARRELARAAIAGALLSNQSRCPVIAQAMSTIGTNLTRGQAMSLVSHSAECSICVPVLRTVDRQIMQIYSEVPVAEVPAELSAQMPGDVAALVERARLVNGFAPLESEAQHNPRRAMMRAVALGLASAVLIVVALLVSR